VASTLFLLPRPGFAGAVVVGVSASISWLTGSGGGASITLTRCRFFRAARAGNELSEAMGLTRRGASPLPDGASRRHGVLWLTLLLPRLLVLRLLPLARRPETLLASTPGFAACGKPTRDCAIASSTSRFGTALSTCDRCNVSASAGSSNSREGGRTTSPIWAAISSR